MNLGDLVVRKSYGGDVTFRVEGMRQNNNIVIKGTEFRLLADAPVDDLVTVPHPTLSERTKQAQIKANESLDRLQKHRQEQSERQLASLRNIEGGQLADKGYFDVPGKVSHLDGDPQYLKKSLTLYNQLRVPAEGHYINESGMADSLYRLLPRVRPDIVVITGHDGVLKRRQPYDLYSLDSYKNSHNFVTAIQVARQYERNLDSWSLWPGRANRILKRRRQEPILPARRGESSFMRWIPSTLPPRRLYVGQGYREHS